MVQKAAPRTVNVTATVVSTPSINTTFLLAFVNAEPTMSLSVTPMEMSSLDYVPTTQADVVVSVRDDFGNPIQGQTLPSLLTILGVPTGLPHLILRVLILRLIVEQQMLQER